MDTKYLVWDSNSSEQFGFACTALCTEDAADRYMSNWYDNGGYDSDSTEFVLNVRDLYSGKLYVVDVEIGWSPDFYSTTRQ